MAIIVVGIAFEADARHPEVTAQEHGAGSMTTPEVPIAKNRQKSAQDRKDIVERNTTDVDVKRENYKRLRQYSGEVAFGLKSERLGASYWGATSGYSWQGECWTRRGAT